MASKFASGMCVDVHSEINAFLDSKSQANLRGTSKHFCDVFDHAFQRGYVAAALHDGFVEDPHVIYKDGDPLRLFPVVPKNLIVSRASHSVDVFRAKHERFAKQDAGATLFVNAAALVAESLAQQQQEASELEPVSSDDVMKRVAPVVEKKLPDHFLHAAPFKAIHVVMTEGVESLGKDFGRWCNNLTHFTISFPCPYLLRIGECWLSSCAVLETVDLTGCTALRRMDGFALAHCPRLETIDFSPCRALESVGKSWLFENAVLNKVNMKGLSSLLSIGTHSLCSCPALAELDLSDCRLICVVGDHCFDKSPSFARLVLPAKHSLTPTTLTSLQQTNIVEGTSSPKQEG